MDQVRDANAKLIKKFNEVNREVFNRFLISLSKLVTLNNGYLQRLDKYLKKNVMEKIHENELHLEHFKHDQISQMMEIYVKWKTYRESLN